MQSKTSVRNGMLKCLPVLLCAVLLLGWNGCTPTEQTIAVKSINLSTSRLSIKVGESQNLTPTVSPSNATDKTVVWSSSNPSVATVNNGTVTGLKVGTATITASCGSVSASCTVEVKELTIAVTGVSLDKTSHKIMEGDKFTLTATLEPAGATYKKIQWTATNTSTVGVSTDLLTATVTGKSPGTSTITINVDGKSDICEVTVERRPIAVESVSVNPNSAEVIVDEEVTLTATINPTDADEKTVAWALSDATIIAGTPAGNTIKVRGLKVGSASVTAKAGEKSATCNLIVKPLPIEITTLSVSPVEITLRQGESATIVATAAPDNHEETITWTSSDPTIAIVDNSGLVKALKEGNCEIMAKSRNCSAQCKVKVTNDTGGSHEGTGNEEW